jgi:folate-binding protein YgfZ
MTTRTGSGRWAAVPPCAVDIRGPDARRWCNGLFTNNVRDLAVGAWNRSAILDDRAHVGGFVDLLCVADDHFVAVVDGLDAEGFLARFERFLLFDRVELQPLRWQRITWLDQAPEVAGRWSSWGGGYAWGHRRSPHPTLDVLAPEVATDGAPVAPELLERLRVEAAVPAFPADTGDKRLPHELGLRDELLHFEKGCYLGQEIVHRVDVQGQVRRTLVRISTPVIATAGSEVRVGPDVVGVLTSPVATPDGGLGLCVIRRPWDAPGTPVQVADLAGVVR